MKGHRKTLDVECRVAVRGGDRIIVREVRREDLEEQDVDTFELVIVGPLAKRLGSRFRIQVWRKA